ncbi:hypothetical protein [Streptomyces sp. BE303]|uniref:hypothetical protein n=1 Tax=Streptomyces sp. BE303 TaxID=3002528 RepID=UPI002E76CD00|nr:hypothetical protein [Streptomyces sp. BE303]MED7955143.1 hypothetical protein [Streptomyces sp. BE303]
MTAARSQSPLPVTPRLSTHATFDREVCELVLHTAPRLFAVVQVTGDGDDEADGRVAAWGLADIDGSAQVFSVDGRTLMNLASPERATQLFSRQPGIIARLVWLAQPGSATLDQARVA